MHIGGAHPSIFHEKKHDCERKGNTIGPVIAISDAMHFLRTLDLSVFCTYHPFPEPYLVAHDSYVGHEPTAATLVSWFGVLLSMFQSFGNAFLLGKTKVKDMQHSQQK